LTLYKLKQGAAAITT